MSNNWRPEWAGDDNGARFEVHFVGKKVDVDLDMHTCTCRFWQLTGNVILIELFYLLISRRQNNLEIVYIFVGRFAMYACMCYN